MNHKPDRASRTAKRIAHRLLGFSSARRPDGGFSALGKAPGVRARGKPKAFRPPRDERLCPASFHDAVHRRKRPRWYVTGILLVLPLLDPSEAFAENFDPNQVRSGALLMKTHEGIKLAPRQNTDIDFVVSGPALRVSMTQRFLNDTADWVEAIYVFPLPDDAAVDHLRIRAGERIIEGEIREKAEARRVYDQAKSEGRRAGLVEEQRPNLFSTSLANLGPDERVEVTIEYQQSVRYDAGEFSLRIPLTLTPRYIPGSPAALVDRTGSGWAAPTGQVPDAARITPPMVVRSMSQRLTLRAVIDAGMPLATIRSRYHKIAVSPQGGRYAVELAQADVHLDHDFELNWRASESEATQSAILTGSSGDAHFAALTIYPPALPDPLSAALKREMIFVIDTSGSMHGNSIAQARAALKLAIARLSDPDRFNVIEFNSFTQSRFPGPVVAGTANRDAAISWVEGLTANNGTEMEPALRAALAGTAPPGFLRQIVFITDGSVGNESRLFEIIRANLGDSRLFTVGIGSAPNAWFMRKAAESGRGSFTYISAGGEVSERMTALFEKLERPVLTDVEIHWPDGIVAESYPATVPDLYFGEPVQVRSKLSGPLVAGTVIELRAHQGERIWRQQLTLSDPLPYPGVPVMWARARIEALSDLLRRGGEQADLVRAITETALSHHIVSPHTSLVAVDKTPARPADLALATRPVPNLLAHGQSFEKIFGFPPTATAAPLQRLTGWLAILLSLALLALSRISGLRTPAGVRYKMLGSDPAAVCRSAQRPQEPRDVAA